MSSLITNYKKNRSMYWPFIILILSVKAYMLGNLGVLNWLPINNQMDIISIILIAVGLAMDSFAVSITSGITIKQVRIRYAAKIALFFALFQVGMPVLGWLAGNSLADLVSGVDHWIALGLLGLIGGKMIYESVKKEKSEKETNLLSTHVLFILSIATSIDAFAVGVSFAFLGVFILNPIIVIGTVTFLLSFLGVFAGNRFGHIFKNKVKIVGGLILIGIGLKILIQDLFLSTPF